MPKCAKYLCLLVMLVVLGSGCRQESPVAGEETLPPSLYSHEDFSYTGGIPASTKVKTVMGIDVSSHQGTIDWPAVAAAGVEFAFIRLGYRGYNSGELQTDAYSRLNLEGAKAAGIAVGAYFFSQAVSVEEAQAEAKYALEILGCFSLDLPLVYDWEYVSDTARTAQVDRRTLTDCTLAFCREAEAAGYEAMVYFNTDQVQNRLYMQELMEYPWWLAKYDHAMAFPCKVDLWQCTNQGSLPGIQERVDVNLMFTEYGLGAEFVSYFE